MVAALTTAGRPARCSKGSDRAVGRAFRVVSWLPHQLCSLESSAASILIYNHIVVSGLCGSHLQDAHSLLRAPHHQAAALIGVTCSLTARQNVQRYVWGAPEPHCTGCM